MFKLIQQNMQGTLQREKEKAQKNIENSNNFLIKIHMMGMCICMNIPRRIHEMVVIYEA